MTDVDMSKLLLSYSFCLFGDTIEFVYSTMDLHYHVFRNGCMTDVIIPRSTRIDTWPPTDDIVKLYGFKEYLCYGPSQFNKDYFNNLFNGIPKEYPELFV